MILFVHTANLGDVISASGIIKDLAVSQPVEVLLRPSFRGLFVGEKNIKEIEEKDLRHSYDLVVDLDSSRQSRKLMRSLNAKKKIGRYANWWRKLKYQNIYHRQLNKFPDKHIVKAYYPVAEYLGLNSKETLQLVPLNLNAQMQKWLEKERKNREGLYVFHIEASNPIRSLPHDLVIDCMNHLFQRNKLIVVVGHPSPNLNTLLQKLGTKVLYRSLSLLELKALLSQADFFVGPDSGPLHLAAALGVKSIGLYGPTLSRDFAPQAKQLKKVEMEFSCRPCNQNKTCKFNRRCLHSITSSQLISEME